MLLFSTDEKIIYNAKRTNPKQHQCKCGQHADEVVAAKYVTFLSLPLFLYQKRVAFKCYRCFRLTITSTQAQLPASTESTLPLMFGWLVFSAICMMCVLTYQVIFPNDTAFRHSPKVNDLYILDAYQLTHNDEYVRYPYLLGKVESIENNVISINLSKWHYRKEMAVIRDLLTRKEQLNSYYQPDSINMNIASLRSDDIVKSVRRRERLVNMEQIHEITGLETKIKRYPSLD